MKIKQEKSASFLYRNSSDLQKRWLTHVYFTYKSFVSNHFQVNEKLSMKEHAMKNDMRECGGRS